jgi:hypothetical protein
MVLRCPHDDRNSRQQITACTRKEERAVSQINRPALYLVDQIWSPAMVLGRLAAILGTVTLIDSGFSMHSMAKRAGRFTVLAQHSRYRDRSAVVSHPRGR